MPAANYVQRVRTALGVSAKNEVDTILLVDLVDRVEDSLILDGKRPGPRAKYFVEKALKRERLAARVKLVQERNGNVKVILTSSGLNYYQNFDIFHVIDPNGPKLRRLTVAELQHETYRLNKILGELLEIIRSKDDKYRAVSSFEELPGITASTVNRVRALGEEYTTLSSTLAEHTTFQRTLRAQPPAPIYNPAPTPVPIVDS
ncbi:hypothetical protein C8Q73DRAFT_789832 [Cubamyces lactineus]|nr:hypothetical protein C8Q73DRAFT_789832 [Cubamyces lactineus]